MLKKTKKAGIKSFSVYELILLAMLASLSIAFKAIVGILVRMITGPLGIPGGALAGGLYMLWLPLAITLTGRRGSAFIISLVQVVVLLTTGLPGSDGIWTLFTYLVPALLVEATYIIKLKTGYNILHYIIATILANIAGTYGKNLLIFRLSIYPLLFTLLAASLSGAIGGVVAHFTYLLVKKTGLIHRMKEPFEKKEQTQDLEIINGELIGETGIEPLTEDNSIINPYKAEKELELISSVIEDNSKPNI